MSAPEQDRRGGASEALRSAIERTFAATAGSAAETRERAGELLDDVARRGQDARDEVTRRGQEAREAPRALIARVGDAVQRLRGVDVEAMRREIESLRKRVAELEQADKSKSKIKG